MKKLIVCLSALLTFFMSLAACVPPTATYTIVRTEVVETVIVPVTVVVAPSHTAALRQPDAVFTPTLTRTIPPTLTPTLLPQPTATFPFLTPTRIVKSVNGVVGLEFRLSRAPGVYRVNEEVWFHFKVRNTTEKDVAYAGIGAVINDKKSQPSWGDAVLGAGATLEWDDHINYGVAGKYKIYLGYCWLRWRYECERAIDANGWAWLSEPIELTITE